MKTHRHTPVDPAHCLRTPPLHWGHCHHSAGDTDRATCSCKTQKSSRVTTSPVLFFQLLTLSFLVCMVCYPSLISFPEKKKDVCGVYLPGPLCLPSGPSLSPLPALPGPSLGLALPRAGLNIWNEASRMLFNTESNISTNTALLCVLLGKRGSDGTYLSCQKPEAVECQRAA